jgi:Fuc2NAc and GlcNAc transferase
MISNYAAAGLLLATAILSWWTTRLVIQHAVRLGLVHAPNARSFHSNPVPHGGGLGIVLAFGLSLALATLVWGNAFWDIDIRLVSCLLGAGVAVAALGLWDDIHPLPARTRLAVQSLAVVTALALLGENLAPILEMPGWLAYPAATLLMLWWLNLFNFMDGIDSLATSEALFVAIAALLLNYAQPQFSTRLSLPLLLLIAASSGFLCLNWPPARIFLGDVGSTFIGYILAVIALASVVDGEFSPFVWLILGGVFWVDSSITLARRIINAESWHTAHRSHAYQRYAAFYCRRDESRGMEPVVARARAHRRVTLCVLSLNILWLLPLAWLVIIAPSWRALWLLLAWIPLLWLTLQSGEYE